MAVQANDDVLGRGFGLDGLGFNLHTFLRRQVFGTVFEFYDLQGAKPLYALDIGCGRILPIGFFYFSDAYDFDVHNSSLGTMKSRSLILDQSGKSFFGAFAPKNISDLAKARLNTERFQLDVS